MITQVGYEIDSEGNIGNETRRSRRSATTIHPFDDGHKLDHLATDLETKQRLSKYAVNTCHKESGIPMSELKSLIHANDQRSQRDYR